MGENNCWALVEALLSFFQCSLWLNPQWDIFRSHVLFSQQTKTKDEKKKITKSKHEGHWNVFFGLIISALLVTRQYPHDLFSRSNRFSVKHHYHSHSKTGKKLNHMCWSKIHIYYNLAFLHSQCCICMGQSQLSLAGALACNISICDLRWLHVSIPPTRLQYVWLPCCTLIDLSIFLPVSRRWTQDWMPLSGGCCVDSSERQRRPGWIKLKWNWYLKRMWCQGSASGLFSIVALVCSVCIMKAFYFCSSESESEIL